MYYEVGIRLILNMANYVLSCMLYNYPNQTTPQDVNIPLGITIMYLHAQKSKRC